MGWWKKQHIYIYTVVVDKKSSEEKGGQRNKPTVVATWQRPHSAGRRVYTFPTRALEARAFHFSLSEASTRPQKKKRWFGRHHYYFYHHSTNMIMIIIFILQDHTPEYISSYCRCLDQELQTGSTYRKQLVDQQVVVRTSSSSIGQQLCLPLRSIEMMPTHRHPR